MLVDKSISEFNTALASASPVPGGGGVSALTAALGTGLGIMVGCLTVGKKKYADVEVELRVLMQECDEINSRLLTLIDGDAAAFEPLSQAYSLPKDAPGRDEIMEKCLRDAAAVPLEIVKLSCRAIELMDGFARMGSALAVSDAGCGAALCRAALEGAALNVFVNTRLMKDRDYAENINALVNSAVEKYVPQAESTFNSVREMLK